MSRFRLRLKAASVPVLTRTSAAGTNRMSWSGSYPNSIQWDGSANGDKVDMQWRVNGGAWNPDTRQVLDSAALLAGSFAWPLFGATSFAAGDFVEAQERTVRFVSGVIVRTSAWSNIVSDTMATGTPFVPSTLFGAGDIGYSFDTTDGSKIWIDVAGTTPGVFASGVGRINDISGKGNDITAQGNNATRPVWANVNNGLIQFDGVDDKLIGIGGFYAKGAMTWIAAVNSSDATAGFLWAETNTGTGNPVYAPGLRDDNSTNMFNYQRNDANTSTILTAMLASLLSGTTKIYMIEDTGTQLTLWVNGVQSAQAAYTRNAPLTGNTSTFGNAVVAGVDFGASIAGYIGSPTVISRVLTGAGPSTAGSEKNSLYNYIATKHGLPTL